MRHIKKLSLLLVLVLCLALAAGCQGKPLPDGMEEASLIDAGEEVIALLTAGDFQAVYDRFREDVGEHLTVQAVEALYLTGVDDAGAYVKQASTLATGQTNEESGEFYGIAVLLCEHQKDDVMYRAAFDTDLTLIGLSIEKK